MNLLEARVALRPRSMSDVIDLAGPFCVTNRRLFAAAGAVGEPAGRRAGLPLPGAGWSGRGGRCGSSSPRYLVLAGGATPWRPASSCFASPRQVRVARVLGRFARRFPDLLIARIVQMVDAGVLRRADRAAAHLRRAPLLHHRGRAARIGLAARARSARSSRLVLYRSVPCFGLALACLAAPFVFAMAADLLGNSRGRPDLADGPAVRARCGPTAARATPWPGRCCRRRSWPAPASWATSTCARARRAGTSSCASWRWPTRKEAAGESPREPAAPVAAPLTRLRAEGHPIPHPSGSLWSSVPPCSSFRLSLRFPGWPPPKSPPPTKKPRRSRRPRPPASPCPSRARPWPKCCGRAASISATIPSTRSPRRRSSGATWAPGKNVSACRTLAEACRREAMAKQLDDERALDHQAARPGAAAAPAPVDPARAGPRLPALRPGPAFPRPQEQGRDQDGGAGRRRGRCGRGPGPAGGDRRRSACSSGRARRPRPAICGPPSAACTRPCCAGSKARAWCGSRRIRPTATTSAWSRKSARPSRRPWPRWWLRSSWRNSATSPVTRESFDGVWLRVTGLLAGRIGALLVIVALGLAAACGQPRADWDHSPSGRAGVIGFLGKRGFSVRERLLSVAKIGEPRRTRRRTSARRSSSCSCPARSSATTSGRRSGAGSTAAASRWSSPAAGASCRPGSACGSCPSPRVVSQSIVPSDADAQALGGPARPGARRQPPRVPAEQRDPARAGEGRVRGPALARRRRGRQPRGGARRRLSLSQREPAGRRQRDRARCPAARRRPRQSSWPAI